MRMASPFAAALVLLSGCIVYQMDKTPPCDGLSDAAKAECKFKPKCCFAYESKAKTQYGPLGREIYLYGMKLKDAVEEAQKNYVLTGLSESGLFSSVAEKDFDFGGNDTISVRLTSNLVHTEYGGAGVLMLFTLFLCPVETANYECSFVFDVTNAFGENSQYRFQETIGYKVGFLNVFGLLADASASYDDVFAAMHRKIVNNLFVKMQKDGFFSAEARDKAAAKADVVEVAKKTVAARRKELEDLKNAGIIDEMEFAAEVKKLEGAGK